MSICLNEEIWGLYFGILEEGRRLDPGRDNFIGKFESIRALVRNMARDLRRYVVENGMLEKGGPEYPGFKLGLWDDPHRHPIRQMIGVYGIQKNSLVPEGVDFYLFIEYDAEADRRIYLQMKKVADEQMKRGRDLFDVKVVPDTSYLGNPHCIAHGSSPVIDIVVPVFYDRFAGCMKIKDEDIIQDVLHHEVTHAFDRKYMGDFAKKREYMSRRARMELDHILDAEDDVEGARSYHNDPFEVNAWMSEAMSYALRAGLFGGELDVKEFMEYIKDPFYYIGKFGNWRVYDHFDDALRFLVPDVRRKMLKRIPEIFDYINSEVRKRAAGRMGPSGRERRKMERRRRFGKPFSG